MIYTKEIIQSILSSHLLKGDEIYQDDRPQCYPGGLVDHLVIELNDMKDTQVQLKRVQDEEIAAKAECEETLQGLSEERADIQKACNHHASKIDELRTVCDICGWDSDA